MTRLQSVKSVGGNDASLPQRQPYPFPRPAGEG